LRAPATKLKFGAGNGAVFLCAFHEADGSAASVAGK